MGVLTILAVSEFATKLIGGLSGALIALAIILGIYVSKRKKRGDD